MEAQKFNQWVMAAGITTLCVVGIIKYGLSDGLAAFGVLCVSGLINSTMFSILNYLYAKRKKTLNKAAEPPSSKVLIMQSIKLLIAVILWVILPQKLQFVTLFFTAIPASAQLIVFAFSVIRMSTKSF